MNKPQETAMQELGHPSPERMKAWQCIGCGKLDGPQNCIGVCQDRRVELVYAADYDKLQRLVNDGRMAGLISWDAIQDRTREVRGAGAYHNSPALAIASVADGYSKDLWADQPWRPLVVVEKDAQLGNISRVCNDEGWWWMYHPLAWHERANNGLDMQGCDVSAVAIGDLLLVLHGDDMTPAWFALDALSRNLFA